MSGRHVETLFCDDIRQEVAGKHSFIGTYSTHLFCREFPTVLPRLCLVIKVIAPAGDAISTMKLRVLRDDAVLKELNLDEQQLTGASDATNDDPEEGANPPRIQVTQFMLKFSPIRFDAPCMLRVHVLADNQELRGIGLKVSPTQ